MLQGGVLSPFTFNVLMDDKLLENIELKASDEVIYYANGICFRSSIIPDMHLVLDHFIKSAEDCS